MVNCMNVIECIHNPLYQLNGVVRAIIGIIVTCRSC